MDPPSGLGKEYTPNDTLNPYMIEGIFLNLRLIYSLYYTWPFKGTPLLSQPGPPAPPRRPWPAARSRQSARRRAVASPWRPGMGRTTVGDTILYNIVLDSILYCVAVCIVFYCQDICYVVFYWQAIDCLVLACVIVHGIKVCNKG